MRDHYQVLGVARDATDADIKQAYRRLASQHHPDKGGDTQKFQEVEAAYRTLSDPAARAQYDNPGPTFGTGPAGHAHFNFDTIFDMFGARFHEQVRRPTAQMQLWISLRDVAQGGHRPVSVATHQAHSNIELEIPQGVEDGESRRFANLAPGGGDLVVCYRVRHEPGWQRSGLAVTQEQLVPIWTLLAGGSVMTRTLLDQEIQLEIPAMTQPNTQFRVRGHGLRRGQQVGDMIVRVLARLPDSIPPDLMALIQRESGR